MTKTARGSITKTTAEGEEGGEVQEGVGVVGGASRARNVAAAAMGPFSWLSLQICPPKLLPLSLSLSLLFFFLFFFDYFLLAKKSLWKNHVQKQKSVLYFYFFAENHLRTVFTFSLSEIFLLHPQHHLPNLLWFNNNSSSSSNNNNNNLRPYP